MALVKTTTKKIRVKYFISPESLEEKKKFKANARGIRNQRTAVTVKRGCKEKRLGVPHQITTPSY